MLNSRTNISSLLVATMSVCACLLLLDSQAFSRQAAFVKKSQSVSYTQGSPRAPLAQSRQLAKLNAWPLADFVSRVLKMESGRPAPAHGSGLLLFFVGVSGSVRAEEAVHQNSHACSSDEVTKTFSMPRETFCALLSKYLSSH